MTTPRQAANDRLNELRAERDEFEVAIIRIESRLDGGDSEASATLLIDRKPFEQATPSELRRGLEICRNDLNATLDSIEHQQKIVAKSKRKTRKRNK